MRFRMPKPQLRLRGLAALIAVVALMIWAGLGVWSPARRFGRLLRADQPAYVRRDAASALGRESPSWEVDRAVGMLIRVLDDPSPRVREQAAAGLAEIGPRAEPAVPRLVAALNDRDRYVRYTAAAALRFLGAAPAKRAGVVAALDSALDDPAPEVGLTAAESLIAMRETPTAAGAVVSALVGTDSHLRDRAQRILRAAKETRIYVALLAKEVRNPDARRRDEALRTLMNSALAGDDPEVRRWAAEQAGKIVPGP